MKTPKILFSEKIHLDGLLEAIISDKNLHAKWLYMLSYLENCGARKIAKFQVIFKENVPLFVLQHASEEFRHAYFMKKQILKLGLDPDLNVPLLGGMKTKNLLNLLDIKILKLLKQEQVVKKEDLCYFAYLLTTFAIEKRAETLYKSYQAKLDQYNSKVSIKSIIKEEENHLEEIELKMKDFPLIWNLKRKVVEIESNIFSQFLHGLFEEILPLKY
jgi:bacterioferritin (cytochrome b1)